MSGATRSLSISCYGARVLVVDPAGSGMCHRLRELLPPEAREEHAQDADVRYEVHGNGPAGTDGCVVWRDHLPCFTAHSVEDAVQWLRSDLDFRIAVFAREGLFVHAGVVGWRGRAIVVPGRSRTGKTRLVAELVRHGARYYSDEYAVLGEDGRVCPYARSWSLRDSSDGVVGGVPGPWPLGSDPIPLSLVVSTSYRPDATWHPETIRGGRALFPLVANTVLARKNPDQLLRLAVKLAPDVVALQGPRPDAGIVAPQLLRYVDALVDHPERAARVVPAMEAAAGTVTTKDVSYVVPTAVPHDHLVKCLESVRRWSPGSEIIVVANGCAPAPDAVRLADRVIALDLNLRFAGGANRGVVEASRPFVCIMNDDARFVDETPLRLVQAASEGKIAGPFSNRAKPPQGDVAHDRVPGTGVTVDTVVGVCMVLPTDLFRTLGGFDTRLDNWEDDDLCLRARRRGVRCEIVGGAYVEHERHATYQALGKDLRAIMSASTTTFRRLHPGIRVVAIARNEARAVEGFFKQFEPATRDWCLLDTGSTDGTAEIARGMGVSVVTTVFRDFAQARNEALERFAHDADWVVMLDPDERLDAHTIQHLEALAATGSHEVFLSPLRAVSPDSTTRTFVPKPFLFRPLPEIRWVFTVHEKLIGSQRQALVRNAMIDHVIALHDGERRARAETLYAELQAREPYHTDPAHRASMRARWPMLDYDRLDDDRLDKILIGPLVSVVVPTYCRRELLERAVASALAQNYVNLEVVVVGDCCPELDPARFRGDPRVRIVNLPANHGAGGAVPRNYGIMLAAGQLVAYLDDDNAWLPDHLSSLHQAMTAAGTALGFSSMQVDGRDLGFTEPTYQGIDSSCLLHQKSLIERHGWWKTREEAGYAHDWEFVSRMVDGGVRWTATRRPTLLYNAAGSGQREFLAGRRTTGSA